MVHLRLITGALALYHLGPRNQTQVIRLGEGHLKGLLLYFSR